jgi:Right handed beta helix region
MSHYGERVMSRWFGVAVVCVLFLTGCGRTPAEKFLQAVAEGKGTVPLPGGVLELANPIVLGPNVNGLTILGKPGDVVRARKGEELRAFFVCRECKNVTLTGFAIEGDPDLRSRPGEAPPADTELRRFFSGNGIVLEGSQGFTVKNMTFKDLSGFAVMGGFDKKTTVEKIEITDSGTRNSKGFNTGAGGLAFTDGSDGFVVRDNSFKRIFGNGVWVHSIARGDRSQNGLIENNRFENISHDAVLVSNGYKIVVRKNTGRLIGYPPDAVNTDLRLSAAVGTEGNVDSSTFEYNQFEQVNGRCFDLDGFHDSEVAHNSCRNPGQAADYPHGGYGLVLDNTSTEVHSQQVLIHDNVMDGMRLGGVFLLGSGHKVVNNKLLRLNLLGCSSATRDFACLPNADEPMVSRSGVYLGLRGARPDPTEGALVEQNEITGNGMGSGNCVVYAPQVKPAASVVRANDCRN